jgi:small redox-active disulfide protein 2
MKIEVVGTGCPTCQKLYEVTKEAAAELDFDAAVTYVSNQDGMKRLMELGLMQSPALVVDDKVAMIGYNPSAQKIKNLILETANK